MMCRSENGANGTGTVIWPVPLEIEQTGVEADSTGLANTKCAVVRHDPQIQAFFCERESSQRYLRS